MKRRFQRLSISQFEEYVRNYNFTRKITEFHVHHTWKPDHTTLRKAKAYETVIYSMYVYHTKERGWSDIGQNITIDDNGDVWLCRDFNKLPASIKGRNKYGFACELIGNFDKGHDVLNGKQLDSLIRAIKVVQEVCGFRNDGIIFHREYANYKTCPGSSINKDWLLNLVDNYVPKQDYDLIKLQSGRVIKGIKNNDDYLIPLSDIEDILMPISIINYDKINYDNKIKEGDFVVLKKGMKGEKVKELQEKLIELGYKNLLGRYGADGVFGQATYTAVIKFQQDNGLKVDGIVGKNTWRKINELLLENKHENIRKEYLQVIVSILNVRNDKWGKIIGQVKKGDILEKIGVHKDGDWYKIKFKDLEGYVSSKYVVPYQNIKGFKKIRKYDSDIYIYETSKDEFVDVTLGQYGKLETLSNIVKNSVKEVMCAVNGGFFDTKGSTEHLGTFVDEGLYYKPPSDNFIDFIYYKDGTTEIKKIKDLKEVAQLQVKTHWVIGTSWSLVKEGKIDLTNANKILHSRFRNPRTLLGQKKDGTFVLVVVDGRRKGSKGMTAKQCGELMLELGCYNAVNLDGGGSSEMIVNNTIVNHPSDGHERRIGSAILVYKI